MKIANLTVTKKHAVDAADPQNEKGENETT
jgi:hypothetical protein